MTNNYPEWEPGGRGVGWWASPHPQAALGGKRDVDGLPRGHGGMGKIHKFGSVSLKMFAVGFHQTSEIQMGSEIPLFL